MEISQKSLGEGAKGVLDPGCQSLLALVQKRVAPVQNRVWVVQKTLGRPLLPGSKTPFAPSPNHFWEISIFGPSPRTLGSQFWKSSGIFLAKLGSHHVMDALPADFTLIGLSVHAYFGRLFAPLNFRALSQNLGVATLYRSTKRACLPCFMVSVLRVLGVWGSQNLTQPRKNPPCAPAPLG